MNRLAWLSFLALMRKTSRLLLIATLTAGCRTAPLTIDVPDAGPDRWAFDSPPPPDAGRADFSYVVCVPPDYVGGADCDTHRFCSIRCPSLDGGSGDLRGSF